MSEVNFQKTNKVFASKQGMGSLYLESGEFVPVTVLKLNEWVVTQVKTNDIDGYDAVQVASGKKSKASKAVLGHLKKSGYLGAAKFIKEIRLSEAFAGKVGDRISAEGFVVGDLVSVSSVSKGKGFAGSVRRFGFAGGPASHGSKFHRRPGSSGNRTWPGRVMPGKKFPGHLGNKRVTVKNLKVVGIDLAESVLMLKGAVPGSKNTLVEIVKG